MTFILTNIFHYGVLIKRYLMIRIERDYHDKYILYIYVIKMLIIPKIIREIFQKYFKNMYFNFIIVLHIIILL